ncbi:MAG TPA: DinB family protein [Dinghuibacter sp.]|jgi:hypothetical protein|uniref:DinB family protein n=1 Tax=Dinghuibacter sp. TaxID=2024697 RepID=UPI002BEF938F|nr:DinB family protein [Dinghuibacter sp.]HTJ14754.1 DinB family protein [Dinghuibacter sp.]
MIAAATAARLRGQHEVLYLLLPGDRPLRERPSPDTWSLLENAAHLAAYQKMFARRVERILAEDEPAFAAYVGDNDPYFLAAREESAADLLVDLSADRLYLYDWITSLGDDPLSRTAVHPKYGRRTLAMWTEFFLLHEAHHLYTMWKLNQ